MFIQLHFDKLPSLHDADIFDAFHVIAPATACDQLAELLHECGKVDDVSSDHVWIDPDWLRLNGPQSNEWRLNLDDMITYAHSRGWLDPAGYLRAHISKTNQK